MLNKNKNEKFGAACDITSPSYLSRYLDHSYLAGLDLILSIRFYKAKILNRHHGFLDPYFDFDCYYNQGFCILLHFHFRRKNIEYNIGGNSDSCLVLSLLFCPRNA